VGGANIQVIHYFDHAYLEEEKSQALVSFKKYMPLRKRRGHIFFE
jgi:hypothetical protein